MSPESPWQGCYRGRELARQGRTGQDTCKQPTAEPCPPLYRQNSDPPGNMTRVLLNFFAKWKSSGHEVSLTTTVNSSVDLNLIRTSACYNDSPAHQYSAQRWALVQFTLFSPSFWRTRLWNSSQEIRDKRSLVIQMQYKDKLHISAKAKILKCKILGDDSAGSASLLLKPNRPNILKAIWLWISHYTLFPFNTSAYSAWKWAEIHLFCTEPVCDCFFNS